MSNNSNVIETKVVNRDPYFNDWWDVKVYRGRYSECNGQVYAIEFSSKKGDKQSVSFLKSKMSMGKISKDILCRLEACGVINSTIVTELELIVQTYILHDEDTDPENRVIVLDTEKGESIDRILNPLLSDNYIDRYHNRLFESLEDKCSEFTWMSKNNATKETLGTWLDNKYYNHLYGRTVLAVKYSELKNLMGWDKNDGVELGSVVKELAARNVLFLSTSYNRGWDITLSSEAKDTRCYIINVEPYEFNVEIEGGTDNEQ